MSKQNNGDFTPTMKGSKEEGEAIRARKEMIGWFSKITPPQEVRRKTWEDRMELRAKGFERRAK